MLKHAKMTMPIYAATFLQDFSKLIFQQPPSLKIAYDLECIFVQLHLTA